MRVWIAAVLLGSLTGCPVRTDPALLAAANEPVLCQKGDDCDMKWSRAQQWVLKNSNWKLQTATDMLLQTFNGPAEATESSFTVSRVARGNGVSEILFESGCGNWIGCIPDGLTLKARFVRFVNQGAAVGR